MISAKLRSKPLISKRTPEPIIPVPISRRTDKRDNIIFSAKSACSFTAGGGSGDSIDEIKQKTLAFFSTQNRCVTKEDYEARTLNVPSKFGNIAKAYVSRTNVVNDNHDGQLNPGESIDLSLSLINLGLENAEDVSVNIYSSW